MSEIGERFEGHVQLNQFADRIETLEAERDALREALEMMLEMSEMGGFGKAAAEDVARTALAAVEEK